MTTENIIIVMGMATIVFLLGWVLYLDSLCHDLKGYIKRMEEDEAEQSTSD